MTQLDTTGRTVVGLFRDRRRAEEAIRDLRASGFSEDRIGLAMQDQTTGAPVADTGAPAAQGAAKGAVSGGLLGGMIGLLGALVPGLGPLVVGGVLASALAGAGIGAATGGLIGALMGIGVPEEDARHFDLGLRSGGALVTVDAGSRTGEALAILQRHEVDLGPGGAGRYDAASRRLVDSSTPVAAVGDVGSAGGLATPGLGAADVASGSSTGNRGMPSKRGYAGVERRRLNDPSYAGPERRLIGV